MFKKKDRGNNLIYNQDLRFSDPSLDQNIEAPTLNFPFGKSSLFQILIIKTYNI